MLKTYLILSKKQRRQQFRRVFLLTVLFNNIDDYSGERGSNKKSNDDGCDHGA